MWHVMRNVGLSKKLSLRSNKRYGIGLCWLMFILIGFIAPRAYAEFRELKIIEAKYRSAAQIVEAIGPMMQAGESLRAIDQHILLKASSERVQEIETLIDVVDKPLKMYKISVSNQQTEDARHQSLSANGQVSVGGRGQSHVDINIDARDEENAASYRTEQFLRVMDGQEAFISAGVFVAFSQQWLDLSGRYPQLQSTIAYQEVSSGFVVRPRAAGQQVLLEIFPRVMRVRGGGVIDFKELSTVISVPSGEWVDIGGMMSQHDDVSRAILGLTQTHDKTSHTLRVKVDE